MTGMRTAAAMMVAASIATAADAQPRFRGGGHGYGYGHHRHGGDGVLGAIVGGLVVGGIVAAVAGRDRGRDEAGPDPRPGEDEAVDRCAARVESETSGTVEAIDAVDRFADGWRVRGTVATGERDAAAYKSRDGFSCSIVEGRADEIRFGGGEAAPAP